MSIPIQKYRTLAEKLYSSTASETLRWQIEPFTEELYTSLGRYKIVLTAGEDAEGSPYIRVGVKSSSGEEVDWFTDTTVSGGSPNVAGPSTYWNLLNDLYTMASRAARGADKALDEILGELDNDDVPF